MKKKIIVRSLLGAPIGIAISTVITIIISLCTGHGDFYPAPHELVDLCGNAINAVLVQTACSIFFGAVCGGSSVIWETEKWSLLKQTLVHLAVISISSFPMAYFLYWIPHNLWGGLAYVGLFIVIYASIWLGTYFNTKAKIKKLNDKLTEINTREGENK